MQPNQKYDIEIISRLLRQIQQSPSFIEFESIKLPFQLVDAVLNLWKSTFDPEVLQELADTDTDTLDAWAIALSITLKTQLEILNSWRPHLTNLPIPKTLNQKINQRSQAITEIANEKDKLLGSASELLHKEEQLRQQASELKSLKDKASYLQKIQEELEETNLEALRQDIFTLEATLEPKKQHLKILQQQKTDLDDKIAALQRQQNTLQEEINDWQSQLNRLETSTSETVSEAIALTQLQRERLSEALSKELTALEQQRSELAQQVESYRSVQQQLQKAQEDFQKYQTATAEILTAINTHYQSDRELGNLLPVNSQKIDRLFRNIQESLEEIDQELAAARNKHEQAQQKNRIPL